GQIGLLTSKLSETTCTQSEVFKLSGFGIFVVENSIRCPLVILQRTTYELKTTLALQMTVVSVEMLVLTRIYLSLVKHDLTHDLCLETVQQHHLVLSSVILLEHFEAI